MSACTHSILCAPIAPATMMAMSRRRTLSSQNARVSVVVIEVCTALASWFHLACPPHTRSSAESNTLASVYSRNVDLGTTLNGTPLTRAFARLRSVQSATFARSITSVLGGSIPVSFDPSVLVATSTPMSTSVRSRRSVTTGSYSPPVSDCQLSKTHGDLPTVIVQFSTHLPQDLLYDGRQPHR